MARGTVQQKDDDHIRTLVDSTQSMILNWESAFRRIVIVLSALIGLAGLFFISGANEQRGFLLAVFASLVCVPGILFCVVRWIVLGFQESADVHSSRSPLENPGQRRAGFAETLAQFFTAPDSKLAIFSLSVFIITALSIWLSARGISTARDLGVTFGRLLRYSVIAFVPAFLAWLFVFKKRPGSSVASIAFLVCLQGLYYNIPRATTWMQAENDMRSELARAYAGLEPSGKPLSSEMREFGPVLDFLMKNTRESSHEFNEFLKQTQALHIGDIFSDATLRSPAAIRNAEQRLITARRIVNAYSRSFEDRVIRTDNFYRTVALPAASREELLKGYGEARDERTAFSRRFIAIQYEAVDGMEKALRLVKTKGSFAGGKLSFSSPADRETFKAILITLDSVSKREAAWFREMQKTIADSTSKTLP